MSMKTIILAIAAIIVASVALSGLFTVRETEQALVMQFGRYVRTEREAGLHWKIPMLQQVNYFDKRILNLEAPAQELIASDQKRLQVDAFARFRIVNPLLTYQAVRNEAVAAAQLSTILQSTVRQVLGSESFKNIVSGDRAALMLRIRDSINLEAESMGIEIVDVRLRRVDLPDANSKAIFERMRTEREREAEEARARGREQAARVRAQAERERTVLLAEAERDAQRIRGEGDATAVKVYADAFGRDPEFFEFYRTMEAYRNALGGQGTTAILSPDSAFLERFGGSDGARKK
ncbi:MAG: protease modulator HflC [Rhodothalassiaceae bacterium]